MTVPRLIAVCLILVLAAASWGLLAASVQVRTTDADQRLRGEVGGLWGQPQEQQAPTFRYVERKGTEVPVEASRVKARFDLDQRRKGLLWYATYAVDFGGTYRVRNGDPGRKRLRMTFLFPTPEGVYDGFAVRVDGREVPVTFQSGGAVAEFDLDGGKSAEVSCGYRTQGLDRWSYQPSPSGVGAVRDLTLAMETDFGAVDFPDGAVSPTEKERTQAGWRLAWRYDNLVSARPIALTMPKPLNPGPVANRITLFAPVSLLFYFAALVLLTSMSRVRLHPMHYAFLAAGFFAFHLLFAYLVDRIDLVPAFALASVTSTALCVGYLWLVWKDRRALVEVAASQLVFLVLFSYTFFFEGLTGLAITIGSIVTLGYFMARTAGVDWETVFRPQPSPEPLPQAPAPAPSATI